MKAVLVFFVFRGILKNWGDMSCPFIRFRSCLEDDGEHQCTRLWPNGDDLVERDQEMKNELSAAKSAALERHVASLEGFTPTQKVICGIVVFSEDIISDVSGTKA